MRRLEGKTALVTGGSSGIGRAIAILFAREGAKVVAAADKNIAGGEETATLIKSSGGDAVFVQCDVASSDDVEGLVGATVEKYGRLDILVNNAGIFGGLTPFDRIDESMWDRIYAVNVKGIWFGARYAAPEMKKVGGGAIVNIASMAGISMGPMVAGYASSKGAAITLTKALALELAPDKIRVNCVNPSMTMTPIADQFPAEARQMFIDQTPLGRLVEPEEIALAALFLASDEAAMVTGTHVNVEGGMTI